MEQWVYLNGRYLPMAEAMVPVEDRGYQFADGIYDVLKLAGWRPVRFREHMKRLRESCEGILISDIPTMAEWESILAELAERSGLSRSLESQCILYIQVTRGVAPRNHLIPEPQPQPTICAYFKTPPNYTPEQRTYGVAMSTQPDERWLRCHIKAIGLLPVVLAKHAARKAGAFEALLVRDGIVTEAASCNVFCVKDGAVFTHPEGPLILSGITRGIVLDAARRLGIPVYEQPVALSEFRKADEAFLSSTTMNVMPVTVLDGVPIGTGNVGPITRAVAAEVEAIIREELQAGVDLGSGIVTSLPVGK